MGRGKTGHFRKAAAILLGCALLTGCGSTGEVDDYATNIGYEARGGNGTTQVFMAFRFPICYTRQEYSIERTERWRLIFL